VLNQLRAEMDRGELPVGTMLPSESAMCARFGVSRITVRRALDELAQAGLIDRSSGRATKVTAPRLVHSIAAFEDPFSPVRLVRDTTVRLLAFAWQAASGQGARSLGLERGEQMLVIARLRLRDGKPVFHTTTYMPPRVGGLVNQKALDTRPLHEILAAEGCVSASIDRQMSAAPCPKGIAEPLELRPGAPTFRIDRLSRDSEGAPLHLLVGHWRWDQFSMRLSSDNSLTGGQLLIDDAGPQRSEVVGPADVEHRSPSASVEALNPSGNAGLKPRNPSRIRR